jgi:hypothetical protein
MSRSSIGFVITVLIATGACYREDGADTSHATQAVIAAESYEDDNVLDDYLEGLVATLADPRDEDPLRQIYAYELDNPENVIEEEGIETYAQRDKARITMILDCSKKCMDTYPSATAMADRTLCLGSCSALAAAGVWLLCSGNAGGVSACCQIGGWAMCSMRYPPPKDVERQACTISVTRVCSFP